MALQGLMHQPAAALIASEPRGKTGVVFTVGMPAGAVLARAPGRPGSEQTTAPTGELVGWQQRSNLKPHRSREQRWPVARAAAGWAGARASLTKSTRRVTRSNPSASNPPLCRPTAAEAHSESLSHDSIDMSRPSIALFLAASD